jgi:hypothetical protein
MELVERELREWFTRQIYWQGRASSRARVCWGQFAARELNATLRFGKDELALEDAAGALAGGRLSGGIAFRNGENGLTTHARISLARADVATLLSTAARPPVTGSLDSTAETEGRA